jgi:PadR family transcriptional regulator, regulatory protein PadR
MANIHGDTLRGHLESLILSALRRGEAHGFEILKRLEQAGSGVLRLKEGSLYPALYRLEAAGLVKAAWEGAPAPGETARRGPRRRIYRLTAKGGRRLEEARGEWDLFVRVIGGILGVAT